MCFCCCSNNGVRMRSSMLPRTSKLGSTIKSINPANANEMSAEMNRKASMNKAHTHLFATAPPWWSLCRKAAKVPSRVPFLCRPEFEQNKFVTNHARMSASTRAQNDCCSKQLPHMSTVNTTLLINPTRIARGELAAYLCKITCLMRGRSTKIQNATILLQRDKNTRRAAALEREHLHSSINTFTCPSVSLSFF